MRKRKTKSVRKRKSEEEEECDEGEGTEDSEESGEEGSGEDDDDEEDVYIPDLNFCSGNTKQFTFIYLHLTYIFQYLLNMQPKKLLLMQYAQVVGVEFQLLSNVSVRTSGGVMEKIVLVQLRKDVAYVGFFCSINWTGLTIIRFLLFRKRSHDFRCRQCVKK